MTSSLKATVLAIGAVFAGLSLPGEAAASIPQPHSLVSSTPSASSLATSTNKDTTTVQVASRYVFTPSGSIKKSGAINRPR